MRSTRARPACFLHVCPAMRSVVNTTCVIAQCCFVCHLCTAARRSTCCCVRCSTRTVMVIPADLLERLWAVWQAAPYLCTLALPVVLRIKNTIPHRQGPPLARRPLPARVLCRAVQARALDRHQEPDADAPAVNEGQPGAHRRSHLCCATREIVCCVSRSLLTCHCRKIAALRLGTALQCTAVPTLRCARHAPLSGTVRTACASRTRWPMENVKPIHVD